MFYFVPAWYKGDSWNEGEQLWYSRRAKSEFDDTIKQIQLFHRNMHSDLRILTLAYSPNFRHFLYRQGLYRIPYWSCFDAIAQIEKTKVAVLSFHNLNWPAGTEFVYSPFAVTALLNGEKYAVVGFGENGNPISVEMFENNVICRKNYYDDRGFVSSSEIYEKGLLKYQDFLMADGVRKMRYFAEDGHVEINPKVPFYRIEFEGKTTDIKFKELSYNTMDQVVAEVFEAYITNITTDDAFIVAIQQQNISITNKCLGDRKYIASFFENRFDVRDIHNSGMFFDNARYIVTDTKQRKDELLQMAGSENVKIKDISCYDTRTDFGISGQLKVQNIMVPIDGFNEEQIRTIMVNLAKYLAKNERAMVHIFTRNTAWGEAERILGNVKAYIEAEGYSPMWATKQDKNMQTENAMGIEGEMPEIQRFFVDSCVDERTISKLINEQRVILDLRNIEDVFVDVTAISKGVPRIGLSEDKYLVDGKNGTVIKDENDIEDVVSYYLDHFGNWNEALVANYEMGQKYTTAILIDSWKEVLSSIG